MLFFVMHPSDSLHVNIKNDFPVLVCAPMLENKKRISSYL